MADESVKHPRGFEPPPWEAEQFEELARKRAAEEMTQRLLTEAASAKAAVAAAKRAPVPVREDAVPEAVVETAPVEALPAAKAPETAGADVMLIGLRAEEPEVLKGAWIVPMVAGTPIILMGLAMGVMGVMNMNGVKQNPAQQSTVSGVMIAGALALLALGGWLVVKSLKTRSIGG